MKKRTFEEYLEARTDRRIMSEYIHEPSGLDIYVRCAIHIPNGIELANISVPARKQKKGIFSSFLSKYETKIPLMIESVLNPDLEKHLRNRLGWKIIPSPYENIGVPSFVNELWTEKDIRFIDKSVEV